MAYKYVNVWQFLFASLGFTASPAPQQPQNSRGLNIDFESVFGNNTNANNLDSTGKWWTPTHSDVFFSHCSLRSSTSHVHCHHLKVWRQIAHSRDHVDVMHSQSAGFRFVCERVWFIWTITKKCSDSNLLSWFTDFVWPAVFFLFFPW